MFLRYAQSRLSRRRSGPDTSRTVNGGGVPPIEPSGDYVKRLTLLLGLLCAVLTFGPALASEYPSRPLRVVVPFPAGGTADILPRIVAEKMRRQFSQGVIVENRPGAGGNIGAEIVAKSDPDGYTVLVSPPGPIAINQSLYSKLGFDPTKLVPVTVLAAVPNVLAVSRTLPVKDVQEFVAYVKANPGKVSYASQGNGSTSHLTANLFQSLTGTRMLHVPYKGTAPALTDLAGGQVDVFFDNLSSSMPMHKGGKIRILAIADSKRSAVMKDVPSFAEAGLPGMRAVTWFAAVAPAGTPASVVQTLNGAFSEALKLPDVRQRFAEQGAEVVGNSPAEMARFVRDEASRWQKVIRDAGVTVD